MSVEIVLFPEHKVLGSFDIPSGEAVVLKDLRPKIEEFFKNTFVFLSSGATAAGITPIKRKLEAKVLISSCLEPALVVGGLRSIRITELQSLANLKQQSSTTTTTTTTNPLIEAAQEGKYEFVIQGIRNNAGADKDLLIKRDDLGFDLLHSLISSIGLLKARKRNQVTTIQEGGGEQVNSSVFEVVSVLLDVVPEVVDSLDNKGQSALHLACAKGEIEIVSLLIKSGADLNALDSFGRTPLHLAATNKHKSVVQELLKNGAKFDIADSVNGIAAEKLCDSIGIQCSPPKAPELLMSPLHIAASSHDLTAISQLLQSNQQPENQEFTTTPLQQQQSQGGLTSLHIFLARKVQPPSSNESFAPLIETAISLGGTDGSVWNIKDDLGKTPLHTAFENFALPEAFLIGLISRVKSLVGADFQIDSQDSRGLTFIHHSARRKFVALTKFLLLQCGASPEGKPIATKLPEPRTPTPTKKKTVKKLGSPWSPRQQNQENKSEWIASPLSLAIQAKSRELAMILANAGAISTSTSDFGEPVLWLAAKTFVDCSDCWEFYANLVRSIPGSNPNQSFRGVSVLGIACKSGNIHGVSILIEQLGVSETDFQNIQLDNKVIEIIQRVVSKDQQKFKSLLLLPESPLSSQPLSPLSFAAFEGHPNLLRYIINRCKAQRINCSLSVPFALACINNKFEAACEIISLMNSSNFDISAVDLLENPTNSPLVISSALGKKKTVQSVLLLSSWKPSVHESICAVWWCLESFAPISGGIHQNVLCKEVNSICKMILDTTVAKQTVSCSEEPCLFDTIILAIQKHYWLIAAKSLSLVTIGTRKSEEDLLQQFFSKASPLGVLKPFTLFTEPDSLEFISLLLNRFGVCKESVALASLSWDFLGFEACIRCDIHSEEPMPFFKGNTNGNTSIGSGLSPRREKQALGNHFYSPKLDSSNAGLFAKLPKEVLSKIFWELDYDDQVSLMHTCRHLTYWKLTNEETLIPAINSFVMIRSRGGKPFRTSIKVGDLQLCDLLVWRSQGITLANYIWEDGVYPLLLAISNAQLGIAELLISRGALVDGPSGCSVPPLHAALFTLSLFYAKECGKDVQSDEEKRIEKIALEIISAGCHAQEPEQVSELNKALKRCGFATFDLPGIPSDAEMTPLSLACYAKSRRVVEKLLSINSCYIPKDERRFVSPMQSLLSPAGTLLTRIDYSVQRTLAIGKLLLENYSTVENHEQIASEIHPLYKCSNLKLAVLAENWELSERLVDIKSNPLQYTGEGCPLDYAAAFSPVNLIEKMLSSIPQAISNEFETLSKMLLEKFAQNSSEGDCNSKEKGSRVKHLNLIYSHVFRCLKSEPNAKMIQEAISSGSIQTIHAIAEIFQLYPICCAALGGRIEATNCILQHSAPWICYKPEISQCLIHAVSYLGHTEVLRLLLDAGFGSFSVNEKGACESTPLVFAAAGGNNSTVALLLERMAIPTIEAFASALANGHSDAALTILHALPSGIDLSNDLPPFSTILAKYPAGQNALLLASSRCSSKELVQEIASKCTNNSNSAHGQAGETPLDCAIALGNSAVASVLVDSNIARSVVGNATQSHSSNLLLFTGLLQNGGDPNVVIKLLDKDHVDPFSCVVGNQFSPIEYAIKSGHGALVEIALAHYKIEVSLHQELLLKCLKLAARVGSERSAFAITSIFEKLGSPVSHDTILDCMVTSAQCSHEKFCLSMLSRYPTNEISESRNGKKLTELCIFALSQGLLGLCKALAFGYCPRQIWNDAISLCRPYLTQKVITVLELAGILQIEPPTTNTKKGTIEGISRLISVSHIALLEWKEGKWPLLEMPNGVADKNVIKQKIEEELVAKVNSEIGKHGLHLGIDWQSLEIHFSQSEFIKVLEMLSCGNDISDIGDVIKEISTDSTVLSSLRRCIDSILITCGKEVASISTGNSTLLLPIFIKEGNVEIVSLSEWLEDLLHIQEFKEIAASRAIVNKITKYVQKKMERKVAIEVLWETFGGSRGIKEFTFKQAIDLFEETFGRLLDQADGSISSVSRVIFLHSNTSEEIGDQGVCGFKNLACVFSSS